MAPQKPNSEKKQMDCKMLIPTNKIEIKGKISYKESSQAWSIIRLKKQLINEFPELKEKRSKFSYELNRFTCIEEFNKFMNKLKTSKKNNLPMLLWIYKETNEEGEENL